MRFYTELEGQNCFFSEIHGKEVIFPAAQKAVRDKLNIAKLDTYGDALEFYST